MNYYSIIISLFALLISAYTFWLTRLKKGFVKMTRPTVIFFGPDGVGSENKVFVRTLLYSTSESGCYIQNMFIRLQRGESVQNFNVWVYDDKGLVRGSGLFINKSGIASNHHFLLPKDGSNFSFLAGEYLLEVYVEVVNESPRKVFEQRLQLTKPQEIEMQSKSAGVFFDWAPNTQDYFSHISIKPQKDDQLLDVIKSLTEK
jgi:hypothetical protein